MFKKTIILFVLILMSSIVYAEAIDKVSFSEVGYGQFNITENSSLCKIYEFKKLDQIQDSRVFVNLIIENYIPTKRDVNILVFLNDNLEKTLKSEEIVKENYIELDRKLAEDNALKICVENSALPLIIISNRSFIGTYIIGEIKETEFYQRVLTSQRYNNTLIPIEIYAENNSAKAIDIQINYANEIFLRNSNLETVSGETSYTGTILPGETKILKYYLKANKTISFATPQATLTYVNEFGETKTLTAKQSIIDIVEKTNKIEVYVDMERNVNINEKQKGKIIIRNVSENDLKNLTIEINFNQKIILSQRQIDLLKKYEVKEIFFETTIDSKGVHSLNATVYYNLGDKENGVSAQTVNITADLKKDYIKEMIGVFLLITIIFYIWIVRF